MKLLYLSAIALLCGLTVATPASAGLMQFAFNYTFEAGSALKGTLIGELQSDMNTIVVQDFELNYNNLIMPIPAGPGPGPQLASLDGELMSLTGFGEHFAYPIFLTFELSSQSGHAWVDLTEVTTDFVLERDAYDPARLQIQRVPLPATLGLMGLGLFLLRDRASRFRRDMATNTPAS